MDRERPNPNALRPDAEAEAESAVPPARTRKEYRSAVRSRAQIGRAFLELMREKPCSRITVTDIVNRAQVNRSTFYAHYTDVNGLVEELQAETARRSAESLSGMDFRTFLLDPAPFLERLTEPLRETGVLYRLPGGSEAALQWLEQIRQAFVRQALASPELTAMLRTGPDCAVCLQFLLGGAVNAYREWITGKTDCPLERVTETVARMVTLCAALLPLTGERQVPR